MCGVNRNKLLRPSPEILKVHRKKYSTFVFLLYSSGHHSVGWILNVVHFFVIFLSPSAFLLAFLSCLVPLTKEQSAVKYENYLVEKKS